MPFEFRLFLDKKDREARKHLVLVKKLLEQNGFKVKDKLDDRNDTHIFVYNPNDDLSFKGVRIYEIGGELAFRIQKESDTHPYGRAYPLAIEKMFEDIIGEDDADADDNKAGEQIMKSIVDEINEFFKQSSKIEHNSKDKYDPLNGIVMRSNDSDMGAYSS